jgi:hypothetical protein
MAIRQQSKERHKCKKGRVRRRGQSDREEVTPNQEDMRFGARFILAVKR